MAAAYHFKVVAGDGKIRTGRLYGDREKAGAGFFEPMEPAGEWRRPGVRNTGAGEVQGGMRKL